MEELKASLLKPLGKVKLQGFLPLFVIFFSPMFFLFKRILNKFGNMEKWVSEQLT